MCAAKHKHMEILEILANFGTEIDAQDKVILNIWKVSKHETHILCLVKVAPHINPPIHFDDKQ